VPDIPVRRILRTATRLPTREIVSLDLTHGARRLTMAGVEKRDFESPDESRTPDKTRMDVVRLGGTTAARLTMEPGWRWSTCVKPVAGTESCQHRHLGVVHSGRMRVTHEDGSVLEIGPGDAYVIEPGHDAEVVGDERFVGFEFQQQAAEEYAR
jgi:mannose-6-phosphate isomerase-like protein (cupin superfamily)